MPSPNTGGGTAGVQPGGLAEDADRVDFGIPGYDPYRDAGGCYYDAEAGQRAVDFFRECLQHVKGEWAGQPFILAPWQDGPTRALFGWKRPDGSRRYRTMFVYVPRKNGKSTWVVGIGLYIYFCESEPGMECYLSAQDIKQAGKVWSIMVGMIEREPELKERCRHYRSVKKLTRGPAEDCTFDVVSPDGGQIHGSNVHLGIVDELHTQPNREYLDGLETGRGARREPLVIYMTTADYCRPSPCNDEYEAAKAVRDGTAVDPSYLPIVYEGSRDDDWNDPAVWARVNPGYPTTPKREFLESEFAKAGRRPSYLNTALRLYLNVQTEQERRWLSSERWTVARSPIDPATLAGEPCYAGLDLASTSDICAFVLLFPDAGWYFVPTFWVPQYRVDDLIEYQGWISDGHMLATPGRRADYRAIRAAVNEAAKTFNLVKIAYDPWNATHLVKELSDEDGLPMVEYKQRYSEVSPAAKEFERRLQEEPPQLRHGGNPVLSWMVGNVAIREDKNGNIMPIKPESNSPRKVDGVAAAVMATGLAMVADIEPDTSCPIIVM